MLLHGRSQSGQDEGSGEDVMPYDIDWETACNDFHPAFALVRGERFAPDAKPLRRKPAAPRPNRDLPRSSAEPGMRRVRIERPELTVPEVSR